MNSNFTKLSILLFLSLILNYQLLAKLDDKKNACNISTIQLFVDGAPLDVNVNKCLYTSKYFKVKVYDCNGSEVTTSLTYQWYSNNGYNKLIYEKLDSIRIGASGTAYNVIVSQTFENSQDTVKIASPFFNTTQAQFFQTSVSFGTSAVNDNFCSGQIVQISPNYNTPTATFQWQKNGVDLTGATTRTLNVSETGSYGVNILDGICSFSNWNAKKINFNTALEASIVYDDSVLCENSTVLLRGPFYDNNLITYQWQKNGQDLPLITTRHISIQNEGDYRVKYSYAGCQSYSKTVKVIRSNKRQKPEIHTPNGNELCTGEVLLTQKNFLYDGLSGIWYKNNIALPNSGSSIYANSSGVYKLVYGTGTCQNESEPINISIGEGKFKPIIGINAQYNPSTTFCEEATTYASAYNPNYTAFQWKKNGIDLLNATNWYSPLNSTDNEGIYTCLITNGTCQAISNPIQLTKVSEIQIFSSYNNELYANRLAKLYLKSVVSQNPNFSQKYVWKRNGVVIPDETLSYLYTSLSGKYTVTSAAHNCFATSPEFILDINIPEYKLTANSGNWEDVSTWENGILPLPTDRINILSNHTIQLPNYEVEVKEVKLDGILNFNNNSTIKLKTN